MGLHQTSKYWKQHRENLPKEFPVELGEIIVGIMLGDATMYKKPGGNAFLKIEQGWKHKEYVDHLFSLFQDWVFRVEPYARSDRGVKSYSFKTMACEATNPFYYLFTPEGKKIIVEGVVRDRLTARGLAYWIMDDGSLESGRATV
ncbi:hypothetical protein DFJ77DRAFT_436193 [Powellomyces hirtus]|nr:hypothetical protein DFJ77DRAFT_436212 [Powellomyces hirtus]KAI8903245.1 hypothetical protein DFJ77DRAFT_436197 [Powellomyces hirtus]KAI8903252.1 hypothetical protein DFJ77DRAFT_436193 [Powellomyces hirtus]